MWLFPKGDTKRTWMHEERIMVRQVRSRGLE